MSRPLLITDCDEVLLHMVVPFADWLGEDHDIDFDLGTADFANALTARSTGSAVPGTEVWRLLRGFFETEMARQTPISGAIEAINGFRHTADIVVLTNLTDGERDARIAQLEAIGLALPVFTNQGGKGEPLARIVADHAPSVAVFVDDLPHQHESVAQHAPDVFRLHMVGEPRLAPRIPPSPAAHARIDRWQDATPWIMDRFNGVKL